MDLHIFRLRDAVEYVPSKPTYAIRLMSSNMAEELRTFPLKDSPLYVRVAEYIFDDVEPGRVERKDILFDERLAERVLREFDQDRRRCEALMVHCVMGQNRSPAVAIALNDIFNLGNDSEELKRKYSKTANRYVHNTLKKVAERLSLHG
jgi:predicted protein tyrosine phosphatase